MFLMIIGNGSGVSRWDATFLFKIRKFPWKNVVLARKFP